MLASFDERPTSPVRAKTHSGSDGFRREFQERGVAGEGFGAGRTERRQRRVRRRHPQEGSTRKEATECGERDRDGREGCGRRERRKILPCLPTRDRGGPRNRLRLPSARRFSCVCQTCARLFLPRSNLCRLNTVFLRLPESVGYAVASLLSADQSAIGGPPDPVPPCVPRRAFRDESMTPTASTSSSDALDATLSTPPPPCRR